MRTHMAEELAKNQALQLAREEQAAVDKEETEKMKK